MPGKARHWWLGWGTWALLLSTLLLGWACQQAREEPAALPGVTSPDLNYASESELLNATLRIDLTAVRVRLVYSPEQRLVQGRAVLDFRIRPVQRRPLFHFEPAVRGRAITWLRLDGETWTAPDSSVLRVLDFAGTNQQG